MIKLCSDLKGELYAHFFGNVHISSGSISEEARMRKHMVVTEASSELIPDGEQQFRMICHPGTCIRVNEQSCASEKRSCSDVWGALMHKKPALKARVESFLRETSPIFKEFEL